MPEQMPKSGFFLSQLHIGQDLQFSSKTRRILTRSLWRWLLHRLWKHQSLSTTTVLFRTKLTQMIKHNLLLKWLLGLNLSQNQNGWKLETFRFKDENDYEYEIWPKDFFWTPKKASFYYFSLEKLALLS